MGVNVGALVAHSFGYDTPNLLLALDVGWFPGAWQLETGADRALVDEGLCTIVGPDGLMAWATPHVLTVGARTRWRWFLRDTAARSATHASFRKVAVSLAADRLVIVPDWASRDETDLPPASTTLDDMIQHLRASMGDE